MSQILTKLDKLSGSECSVLFSNGKPIASTFPKDKLIYLKLGQQAFAMVFKNAHKSNAAYNEAHIQIGDDRLICFRLDDGAMLISMIPERSEIYRAQRVLRESQSLLKKMVLKSTPEN